MVKKWEDKKGDKRGRKRLEKSRIPCKNRHCGDGSGKIKG